MHSALGSSLEILNAANDMLPRRLLLPPRGTVHSIPPWAAAAPVGAAEAMAGGRVGAAAGACSLGALYTRIGSSFSQPATTEEGRGEGELRDAAQIPIGRQ